jgi:hypothetical protein
VKISGACASQEYSLSHPTTVTCIGTGQLDLEATLGFPTVETPTDSHLEVDESELSEFLLDTFDSMEGHGSSMTEIDTAM